jgi:hypothetical protein
MARGRKTTKKTSKTQQVVDLPLPSIEDNKPAQIETDAPELLKWKLLAHQEKVQRIKAELERAIEERDEVLEELKAAVELSEEGYVFETVNLQTGKAILRKK